jgi:tetratricopeptide (TPR) repeat protein
MTASPAAAEAADALRSSEAWLPLPLAVGLKQYRDIHPDRAAERMDALLKVAEVLVKLSATIAAKAFLLDGAPGDAARAQLRDFSRPALGHWLGLLRATVAAYADRPSPPLIDSISSWYNAPLADDGVQAVRQLAGSSGFAVPAGRLTVAKGLDACGTFRNKTAGHGGRVSDDEYCTRHDALVRLVAGIVRGLSFLADYPLVFVEEVRVRAGDFYATLRVGRGREFDLREARTDGPLQDARLYAFAFDEADAPTFALDLSPFLIFRSCPTCHSQQVFVFNGHNRGLEYLSYQCGHLLAIDDASTELDNIERFLAGGISLYSLFHGKTLGARLEPGPVGATREARARAAQLVSVAIGLLKHDRHQDALPLLHEALGCDADSGEANLWLGIASLAVSDSVDTALGHCRRAAELRPDAPQLQYALAMVARARGAQDVATDALSRAISLDPANQRYAAARAEAASTAPALDDSSSPEERRRFAASLVEELANAPEWVLPRVDWWMTALPPWLWIRHRPMFGALTVTSILLAVSLAASAASLSGLRAAWLVNVAALQFLGLYCPFLFPKFLRRLHQQLRSVVNLPEDTFRRWFLAEAGPFLGPTQPSSDQGVGGLWRQVTQDRFNYGGFLVGFALFIPFQIMCAMGLDPFRGDLATIVRYGDYFLEVLFLAWIPPFVVRGLQFIPRFRELPIRHFVDMPDSVSLKPLATFFLKIASLGTAAYLLFTIQHYLFRTHATVPAASIAFIAIVYSLFFALMFASQATITVTMARLKERRLAEYAAHLEKAFDESMRSPSTKTLETLALHRTQMRTLRRGFGISGFTPASLAWFITLSVVEVAVLVGYLLLVRRGLWLA